MKPVERSAFVKRTKAKFNSQTSVNIEDLFLPSVIEIVKHLARVAAETDYKHFVATGNVPFSETGQETGHD